MRGSPTARLARRLLGTVVVLVACAAGMGAGAESAVTAQTPAVDGRPVAEQATVPVPADGRVDRLLRTHHCWTADAPAGAPVPEHAVVTLPGRRTTYVAADVGFGIWLDGDPGILHGFCP